MTGSIRNVRPGDLPALKAVIAATGLFPAAMLDDMIAGYLAGEGGDEIWLTLDAVVPLAVAYCAPERMASGTWNLHLIAVHPGRQGEGLGTAIVRHVEAALAARGAHLLLVETSGLPEYERTRAFYRKAGYEDAARIRDFYKPGEDKVVFRKALARTRP